MRKRLGAWVFVFAVDTGCVKWLILSVGQYRTPQSINTMKPKDIFKLAIRLVGLVFLYHGLSALPTIIPFIFTDLFRNYMFALVMSVWQLAMAWWLLGGAPLLLRRAYPDTTKAGGEGAMAFGEKADA